jgi:DNA-directed RNA polymerase subunit RPC12/RpoP
VIRTRYRWPGMPGPLKVSPLACRDCGGSRLVTKRTKFVQIAPGITRPTRAYPATVCLACQPPVPQTAPGV